MCEVVPRLALCVGGVKKISKYGGVGLETWLGTSMRLATLFC